MSEAASSAELRALARYEVLGTVEELSRLKAENADRRQKNKQLTDEVEALKAKVPPEGARVLNPEEAKAWEAFVALGKPEDLTKAQEELVALRAKDAERTRVDALRAAVAAEKWPDGAAELLADSKRADGATYTVAKEKQRGQDGKEAEFEVGYITLAGEGQKPMRLADFAKESLPALLTLTAPKEYSGGGGRAAPEQRGGGAPASTASTLLEKAKEANKQRAEAPNALRPAPATT